MEKKYDVTITIAVKGLEAHSNQEAEEQVMNNLLYFCSSKEHGVEICSKEVKLLEKRHIGKVRKETETD